ncbi:MAG: flagellar functional protein, partial [Helicobacter sp.]|nr:flagellar functional protein [Helicobacter sp.]
NYFLKIQAAIKSENYENALELIEDMLKLYPNTIFKRDILYLKIVALDSLGKEEYYQDILQLSKEWYDSYPADINVPEILYILAKTYAKMDFFEEATHYYHRLFEEYKGSDFELLGKLEYGKNLYARGDRKTVLEIYQSVLAQSKNVEIASLASILIAEYYKNAGNKEQAQKYLEDVLRANPGFFAEDISYYHHLMKEWSESGIYFVPAQVAESMFKILDEDSKDYKDLLKDVALWYDKSGNFPKAHYYYQLLLQQKLDEQERSMFQNLDDSLLLKYDEEDVAKRLEHYEYVLKNYKGKEEAQKALAKKIQTLLEQKRYQEIFDLRQTLEESNPILLEAVSELTKEALLQNNCRDASYYGGLYAEKIPLSDEQSFALFECLYQNKRYKPAQQIAQVRSQDSNTAKQKEKWLYALAWAEYQMQNYPKATLAARDALSLLSDSAYNDVVWVLFMALSDQNRKQEALNLLPTLEEKLQDSDKMIEVYRIVLLDAIERKDDTAIEIYAKKLMDLQTKYSRHEYSPWVELSLVDAFNRESRFAESLTLLKDAEKYATKPLETVQIYYLEGYLNSKLKKNQESLEAYTKCEEVEIQSPWKNLCKDAKRLLENQIKDNQSIEEK